MKVNFTQTFFLFVLLLIGTSASAQNQGWCGTEQMVQQLYQDHPELLQEFLNQEAKYDKSKPRKDKGDEVYIIPIVFHVLHQNGPENISDAQIFDQIEILNRDMRKLNADTSTILPLFRPIASDIKIEFRLAQIDPDGNCTNGIDRIYTTRTNSANDSSKLNPWPREKYLNVWTARKLETGWAGYAYYPSAVTGSMIMRDGIMMLQDYVGSIGTSNENKSRCLTHEVGHWLDLGHPWNRTINISINVGLACGDDAVDDTPTTKGHQTCPDLLTPDCYNEELVNGVFHFDNVTQATGTTDPTAVPAGLYDLNITPFKAVGINDSSTVNGAFSFNGWSTGAPDGATAQSQLTGDINTSKYYEFMIAPKLGNVISISGLKFKVNRSDNGPRNYAVRSSVNNFSTNANCASTNSDVSVTNKVFFIKNDATTQEDGSTITLAGYTNRENPITFRIYAWNAEDTTGSFAIDSLTIQGLAGVVENIQNHMEYSYCTNMFTKGQSDRMRVAVESPVSGRSNLWSPSNLIATGVANPAPCKPSADFSASMVRICKGNTITFTKNVSNGTETTRAWAFEGGTPPTSTLENPVIKYNTPGVYSVTFTATNGLGTSTETKTNYIVVEESTAQLVFNGGYAEGFDNASVLTGNNWSVVDLENNNHSWKHVIGKGLSQSNGLMVDAFGSFNPDMDELISPSFDFSGSKPQSLSFKYSGATRNVAGAATDVLNILFSKDCGKTWSVRGSVKAEDLANNGVKSTSFTTDANSIWNEKTITINSTYWVDKVFIKFQYVSSDSSNNVYFDDFRLNGTAGLNENMQNSIGLSCYPNPAQNSATISYHLIQPAKVQLQLVDIAGKVVFAENESTAEAGNQTTTVSKKELNLNGGVYFIKLSVDGQISTQKLVWLD